MNPQEPAPTARRPLRIGVLAKRAAGKAAPDALRAQLHRVQVVELPQDVEDHALGRDQVGVLLPALRLIIVTVVLTSMILSYPC